jgi:hypothetical protein
MNRIRFRYGVLGIVAACALGLATYLAPTAALAVPVQPHFNHFLSTHINGDARYDDNNPDNNLAQQQYSDRAYPNTYIGTTQATNAYNANQALTHHLTANLASNGQQAAWTQVGPTTPNVAAQATYTGRPTVNSGRITSLAVDPNCNQNICRVYVGAAGGGVWRTNNGLATKPSWQSASNGLTSNAIGSLTIDPTNQSGSTIYAGTGEDSGSSDSEAGVGLFKSTDYGQSWHLLSGSVSAAKDRSIGAVVVDPSNFQHIYIGTDVARHGSSSSIGGRFTPPDAPKVGLYESLDGGRNFKMVFSKESDVVNPGSPNGSDFFRGGITNIQYYQHQIYFSVSDYGLYRSASGSFEQIFASPSGGSVANSSTDRTEFALAPMGKNLRIYLGNSGITDPTTGQSGNFYRTDNANVPASQLTNGTANPGWTRLDNSQKGTPGYASYDFCEGQCNYDMFVASPANHPNNVWLGGSMNYNEIFTNNPPSNGRAVQRSTNAGVNFTDMTNDTQTPLPLGMHPDQHALAFDPQNPDIAFIGSDGGLVRTSGTFANASNDCNSRGISGADLTDCQAWLSKIPTRIFSLNDGLADLQFSSVTYNPQNPNNDLIGGTQDNGTFSTTATPGTWTETVGGDGGQSVIDVGNPNIRMHTYYGPNGDVNFNGNDPNDWNLWADPLTASNEAASFYVPLIGDPQISQTMFIGLQHVWRTQDSGGNKAYLRQYCNEITGQYNPTVHPCGDWVRLGPDLTSTAFGADKAGNYVVAIERAPSNTNTMWAATRLGRLFVSTNANAADAKSVSFTRIDTAAQPNRFISGIAVDPKDPNHAYVTFSGYNAYTPNTPGHVFDVYYNAQTGKATWKDISYDLGDQPITGVAYNSQTGNIYIATDFGVDLLHKAAHSWGTAAKGLPMTATYGLTLSESGHVLYAATHGRGAWKLNLK